jgi:RNA polymerase sigma-70 factor (ECF subfamily)
MDSDALLLNAAKKKNEEALARIFDLYASSLYHYALRSCDDPLRADDIVGTVFTEFVAQISIGAGPAANLRLHLYRIAYQLLSADVRRDRWTGSRAMHFIPTTGGSSPSESDMSRELLEAALRVIKYDLTDDQRHVLFLRFLEGFTLKETAAILGKKIGNVKVIQNRATSALRRTLEHQGYEITEPPLDITDFLTSSASERRGEYHPNFLTT